MKADVSLEQEGRKRAIRLPFSERINRVLITVGATALFAVSLLLGSYLGTSIYRQTVVKTP